MLEHAFHISLFILFVNYCFLPGSIFGFIGEKVSGPDADPVWRFAAKPVFLCTVCMAPYYTFIICYLGEHQNIYYSCIMMFIVGGMNVIISSILGFLNSYNGL